MSEAGSIIHIAATKCAATAAALAQGAMIGADAPILTAIQTSMVNDLAQLCGHDLSMGDVFNYLLTQTGAALGVAGAKAILGPFPFLGNIANASVTFTHTEALGWAAYEYFKNLGD